MKITFITQFFAPDIQATSKVFLELCEDLAKENDVKVICGQPLVEPGRKMSKTLRKESYNGMEIIRVATTRHVKKTFFNRILNHVSFMLSSVWQVIFNHEAEIVIFTSDNPLNFIPAVLFFRRPKIYICQDLYMEQGMQTGVLKDGFASRLLGSCQKASFKLADKTVVIGERMGQYLTNEQGVQEEKITVISNWADTEKLFPEEKNNSFSEELGILDKFVVMHSGRMGLTQNLDMLLDCASDLREHENIKFIIIGEGAEKTYLKRKAKKLSLENVIFRHYQAEETLRYVFSSSSVSVLLFKSKLSHSMVPSRLYSFMACGRPVIASIDEDCSAARIIEKSGCGTVIDIRDREAIGKAILDLYNNPEKAKLMGRKGREYIVNHFSRKLMTDKYNTLIKSLVENFYEKRGHD